MIILKVIRQLIAAATLLVWVCAHLHFAANHGGGRAPAAGKMLTSGQAHAACVLSCHEHRLPCGERHRLDFAPTKGFSTSKSLTTQLQAPRWLVLCDKVFAKRAALVLEEPTLHERLGAAEPQPDKRSAGWLFLARTALSVRGPSALA